MSVWEIMRRGACAATTGVGLSALTTTMWVCATSTVLADTIAFKAELTGASEYPPSDSKGTGHCDVMLETDFNVLSWTCTYSGVSGPLIAAHFDGPASYKGSTSDKEAPIQAATSGDLTSPFKGTAKIDGKQAHDLRLGLWYFDLHTKKYPSGEIRGPVVRK